jgi:hypothetical protein
VFPLPLPLGRDGGSPSPIPNGCFTVYSSPSGMVRMAKDGCFGNFSKGTGTRTGQYAHGGTKPIR